jgi:putative FmdB family regulatory protein
MPLYEYECFLCHHRFERIQAVSAEPVRECPECGGVVRRLLGIPALQFKGSGWYVTDYGNGRSRGTTETSNGNGSDSSSSGDKSSQGAAEKSTKKDSEKPSP